MEKKSSRNLLTAAMQASKVEPERVEAVKVDTAAFTGAEPRARHASAPSMLLGAMKFQEELARAEERLAAYDGAGIYKHIDPGLVDRSRFADRDEALMCEGQEWEDWLELLRVAGGNTVPVKVVQRGERYEAVFGHRRTRGCQMLGLPLLAMIVADIAPREQWLSMRQENEGGRPLSVVEKGKSYRVALDEKIFASPADIARMTGDSKGNVSVALKAAEIPMGIYTALGDWRQITWSQVRTLLTLHQEKENLLLDRAASIPESVKGLIPRFNYLISRAVPVARNAASITSQTGEVLAKFKQNGAGLHTLAFNWTLGDEDLEEISALVRTLRSNRNE
jgi:ParB family transcriptional regulator, chromosome partitioning protein